MATCQFFDLLHSVLHATKVDALLHQVDWVKQNHPFNEVLEAHLDNVIEVAHMHVQFDDASLDLP